MSQLTGVWFSGRSQFGVQGDLTFMGSFAQHDKDNLRSQGFFNFLSRFHPTSEAPRRIRAAAPTELPVLSGWLGPGVARRPAPRLRPTPRAGFPDRAGTLSL